MLIFHHTSTPVFLFLYTVNIITAFSIENERKIGEGYFECFDSFRLFHVFRIFLEIKDILIWLLGTKLDGLKDTL